MVPTGAHLLLGSARRPGAGALSFSPPCPTGTSWPWNPIDQCHHAAVFRFDPFPPRRCRREGGRRLAKGMKKPSKIWWTFPHRRSPILQTADQRVRKRGIPYGPVPEGKAFASAIYFTIYRNFFLATASSRQVAASCVKIDALGSSICGGVRVV